MKKGTEIEIKIQDMEFPSQGIAEKDGVKFSVKNAFPGEVIKGKLTKYKKGVGELRLLELVEKAEYEVQGPCPHYGPCGGCISQHVPYDKQLEFKELQVKKLFEKADINMGSYLGIEGSPTQWEYRNKMEFTFGDFEKGGELSLGMHVRGQSFSILSVPHCLIVDEDFRKILDATLEYFKKQGLPHYKIMQREGYLRNLIIRKAFFTKKIMVNLVTTTQINFDLQEYKDILNSLKYEGTLDTILHTENDSFSDAVVPDKVNLLQGKGYITEKLLGLNFKISPFSFFQTNSQGAEALYSVVREFLGDAKNLTVFDLYCGTGTIGQIAAAKAKEVIGIELIEEAAAAANENAGLNNLTNCTFLAGDVTKVIQTIDKKPDVIILDPPRSGVHPKALEYVVKFNAKEIIYVSCNPKTLVIDLKYLEEQGYRVEKSKMVDMFPNTPHVETVVKLVK
ncbi:23S rRNA (uracil(1939)-C(5))-methyltransferase RlmD [Clostridium polynesiense]|uniref:23S rRNA (uracil(1939)-C(5))-methyltransferase RlmD n=1 Tax=Clostridium polynesiense TaxID=1325933 RepID=UPI00058DF1A3|nr:23S rRNA (uracil(1939)-C(5))-methyltransferase RlmD [Clostridium polynesiense]